jgi:hypothetical protein
VNCTGAYRRAETANVLDRYQRKVAEHMGGTTPFTREQVFLKLFLK